MSDSAHTVDDDGSPPPASPTPYRNLTAALASFFARDDGDTTQFSESQIQQISDLLSHMNRAWSRVPRTYIVLRISGQLHHLDTFIDLGFTDHWFPVSPRSLPECLNSSARVSFMDAQSVILTKALDLEKGEDGKHRHFAQGEPLPFEAKTILGSGGFGQVDEVVSLLSYKKYARKRIRRKRIFEKAKMSMKSYINELEVLKRIQHSHIVELVGSYTDQTFLGLIMSPVADYNLSQYFSLIPASPDKAPLLRSFFGCLANAIAYLHDSKIRHKDIKPSNILIKGNNVLLTDFGLSHDSTDSTRSTTEGITAISPRYCAPEVAEYEPRNSSSDIWSLGCVFLEMVTILKGETIDAMKAVFDANGSRGQHFHKNPEATLQWILRLRVTGLQSDSEPLNWISRMLQLDRHARSSARALVETIRRSGSVSDSNMNFYGICCAEDDELAEDTEFLEDAPAEEFQALSIETTEMFNRTSLPVNADPNGSAAKTALKPREAKASSNRYQALSSPPPQQPFLEGSKAESVLRPTKLKTANGGRATSAAEAISNPLEPVTYGALLEEQSSSALRGQNSDKLDIDPSYNNGSARDNGFGIAIPRREPDDSSGPALNSHRHPPKVREPKRTASPTTKKKSSETETYSRPAYNTQLVFVQGYIKKALEMEAGEATEPMPPPPRRGRPTDEDARRARIPAGYSVKNWDPLEVPILLLGSVFDANSLGKWIYDWSVFYYGSKMPMSDLAGELWLLLIQLAGKVKYAQECLPRVCKQENQEIIEDSLDSGDRLWVRFKRLLKTCEEYMWAAARRMGGSVKAAMGENSAYEFLETIFGRDRELEKTEKLMTGMRLWTIRFEASCMDILGAVDYTVRTPQKAPPMY